VKLADSSAEYEPMRPTLTDITDHTVDSEATPQQAKSEEDSSRLTVGILIFGTSMVYIDMLLDGRVSVTLMHQNFRTVVALLCTIAILPQLLIWTFLKMNNMTNLASLLRILVCPSLGALIGLGAYLELHQIPGGWWLLVMFFSFEPGYTLYRSLRTSPPKEIQVGFWGSVGEGLIEAPCSACITLYLAVITAAANQKAGLDPLFIASVFASVLSITRIATKLHYYGDPSVSWTQWLFTFFVMKLPQTTSQILAFSLFAFLTRPFPHSQQDLKGTTSYTVFLFLFQELVLNLNMLRTMSPSMTPAVASLFAAAMAFSGPPGFLTALDTARIPHAAQHFILIGVMFGTAHFRASTPTHWEYLWQEHAKLMYIGLLSWVGAFIINIVFARRAVDKKEALHQADFKLEKAIKEGDYIMGTLLMEVEGVKLPSYRLKYISLGAASSAKGKWNGICVAGLKLYCAPSAAKEMLVLDPSQEEDSDKVSYISLLAGVKEKDKEKVMEKKFKYSGICSMSNGSIFCAPFEAKEILCIGATQSSPSAQQVKRSPLDAARRGITGIKEDGPRTKVNNKYSGICAHQGRLFMAPASAKDAIAGDVADDSVSKVVDLNSRSTGAGGGSDEGFQLKYRGICPMSGKLYCAPFNAKEVMVIDPDATDDATRIGHIAIGSQSPQGGGKWDGICSLNGKLYCAPFNASDVLILDPQAEDEASKVTLLPLTSSNDGASWMRGGAKYSGICALGGKLYCAPYDAEEVLVIDPDAPADDQKISYIPLGSVGRQKNKWQGICAFGGRLYCAPADAQDVLVIDPVGSHSLAAHVASVRSGAHLLPTSEPSAWSLKLEPEDP